MQLASHPLGSRRFARILVLLCVVLTPLVGGWKLTAQPALQRVIVQGRSVAATTAAVQKVGGNVLMPLAIINGASAELTASAVVQLGRQGLIVTPDYGVRSTGGGDEDKSTQGLQLYPREAVGAHPLDDNLDGHGVTVAFVDSGFPQLADANKWTRLDRQTLGMMNDHGRFVVYRDQLADPTEQLTNSSDPYGHGTHIAMTVGDRRSVNPISGGDNDSAGVAPGTNLVMVRALDEYGQGEYSKVIAAIDWIVANRVQLNVRVLNLSLDGAPAAPYWVDPLGVAVMKAWQAGIVVVAAAGNRGPDPMTIGVPGNVPYVITVGAIKSGRYTTSGADELAQYSSAGPTESKFVKPDVVVPASRTLAVLPQTSHLAVVKEASNLVQRETAPQLDLGGFNSKSFGYYQLSGTSMAAAEVSGIVALLLQDEPGLTNNQVKYRLTSTARQAGSSTGAQYSIWQQGAGRVDAVTTLNGTSTQAANVGMDIGKDVLGESGVHYLGTTTYDSASDTLYMMNQPTADPAKFTSWSGGLRTWTGGTTTWSSGMYTWSAKFATWSGSMTTWSGSTTTWSSSFRTWAGSRTTWASAFASWAGTTNR